MSGYTISLRVGSHEWDTFSGETAKYGPVAGLSFGWEPGDGFAHPAPPKPATAAFGLIAEYASDLADITTGDPVHIVFTDGPLVAVFGGRVADIQVTSHPLGALYDITATDYTLDLTAATVGVYTWPNERKYDRLARIAAESTLYGSAPVAMAGTDPTNPTAFLPEREPGIVSTYAALTDILDRYIEFTAPVENPNYEFRIARRFLTQTLDGAGNLTGFQVKQVWREPLSAVRSLTAEYVSAPSVWSRVRQTNRIETILFDVLYGFDHPSMSPGTPRVIERVSEADFEARFYLMVDDHMPGVAWEGESFTYEASRDPAAVVGFLDPVTAATLHVEIDGIAPRWNPNADTAYEGLVSSARLVVPPGGRYVVDFTLRGTFPRITP